VADSGSESEISEEISDFGRNDSPGTPLLIRVLDLLSHSGQNQKFPGEISDFEPESTVAGRNQKNFSIY
jgi:hypothetical protein